MVRKRKSGIKNMEKRKKKKEKDYLQAKGFRAFFCHTQPSNQQPVCV